MVSQEELRVERRFDFDKNETDRKQLPRIKKLKILQILFPFIILLVCGFLFAFFYWLLEDPLVNALIWSCLPLIGWIAGQVGAYFIIRKANKRVRDCSVSLPSNQKWIINKNGINVNAEVSDSVLSWDYISKVDVTSHLIVFYLTRRHSFFIPKYILDEKALNRLHKIIEENLGSSKINFIEDKKQKEKLDKISE